MIKTLERPIPVVKLSIRHLPSRVLGDKELNKVVQDKLSAQWGAKYQLDVLPKSEDK